MDRRHKRAPESRVVLHRACKKMRVRLIWPRVATFADVIEGAGADLVPYIVFYSCQQLTEVVDLALVSRAMRELVCNSLPAFLMYGHLTVRAAQVAKVPVKVWEKLREQRLAVLEARLLPRGGSVIPGLSHLRGREVSARELGLVTDFSPHGLAALAPAASVQGFEVLSLRLQGLSEELVRAQETKSGALPARHLLPLWAFPLRCPQLSALQKLSLTQEASHAFQVSETGRLRQALFLNDLAGALATSGTVLSSLSCQGFRGAAPQLEVLLRNAATEHLQRLELTRCDLSAGVSAVVWECCRELQELWVDDCMRSPREDRLPALDPLHENKPSQSLCHLSLTCRNVYDPFRNWATAIFRGGARWPLLQIVVGVCLPHVILLGDDQHAQHAQQAQRFPALRYLVLRDTPAIPHLWEERTPEVTLIPTLPALRSLVLERQQAQSTEFSCTQKLPLESLTLIGFHLPPKGVALLLRGLSELRLDKSSMSILPALPASLRKLALNGCAGLTRLSNLPSGLSELILWHCHALLSLAGAASLKHLRVLSISSCSSLTEREFQELLSPPGSCLLGLQKLEIINCSGLKGATAERLRKQAPAGATVVEVR